MRYTTKTKSNQLPTVTIVMRHSKYILIRSSSEEVNRGMAFHQVQMAPTQLGVDPYFELDGPQTEVVVEPLDAAADMPEGLSFDVWDRLLTPLTPYPSLSPSFPPSSLPSSHSLTLPPPSLLIGWWRRGATKSSRRRR